MLDLIENQIRKFHTAAQELWIGDLEEWPLPNFTLCDMGTYAGYAMFEENWLAFNPYYYLENKPDFLFETVGHEMAHLIAYRLYGERAMTHPHGKEWGHVMVVLGLPVKIKHTFSRPKRHEHEGVVTSLIGLAA